MKLFAILLLAASCAASAINGTKQCEPSMTRSGTLKGPICKGALIFEDTFDSLDMSKWSHEVTMAGGGNNEFQIYWPDSFNSFVDSGNLNIHPGKLADVYGEDFLYSGTIDLGDSCTVAWNYGCVRVGNSEMILNPATSARLTTFNSFSFTYGTVEIRAKMPTGDWLWTALWMMPKSDDIYGLWPLGGEVDIVESRGNKDLVSYPNSPDNIGVEQVASTLHWGHDREHDRFETTRWERNSAAGNGYNQDFHTYRIEWTPDHFIFSVDDVELGRIEPPAGGFYEMGGFANEGLPNPWAGGTKMAPFDEDFFIILCLAVGGTSGYWPDGASNPSGRPWTNSDATPFKNFWEGRAQWESTWQWEQADLVIDHVRVWAMG